MHKNDGTDLTKKDWRKVIIRALCEANTQGSQGNQVPTLSLFHDKIIKIIN